MMTIKIEEIRNPRFANAEGTRILCEAKFSHLDDFVEFMASVDDVEEHGRVAHAMALEGAVAAYVPPPVQEVAARTIVAIEIANPITHRALRELILSIGEAFPAAKDTVFYQRVLQVELAIRAERSKL